MLAFQERMFNEFKELNERREKLGNFIGSEKFYELPIITPEPSNGSVVQMSDKFYE